MSTALYRRYRPETFGDVIGQEHVTGPLVQALRAGKIGHAYLFSGPRGCGKTTSARILARCLNCEQGPTPEPCGTCESCVALARGGPGTVDVIEIDAASHGGVDDARDLRERAAYGPAQSRYKVYIIDEAHMVTSQGFNALLKIVEEPPEHVKFIFATTEPEKVIGTIRSRTHHYPFRLVPPARLLAYTEQLCESEGVQVAPGVLSFVVRAGGGSVRDSLSVLDQLMAGSGAEGLTYESAAALLGFTDGELLDATVDAFAAADAASVFRTIDKVVETGLDPRRFVEDLLERLRDLIVVHAVQEGAAQVLRHLPEDQIERMRRQAAGFGAGALSRAADIVNAGLTEMTGATAPRLQLELIAARVLLPGAAGEAGYAARLDRLERRLEVGGVPSAAPAPLLTGPPPQPAPPVQAAPPRPSVAATDSATPRDEPPAVPAGPARVESSPATSPPSTSPSAESPQPEPEVPSRGPVAGGPEPASPSEAGPPDDGRTAAGASSPDTTTPSDPAGPVPTASSSGARAPGRPVSEEPPAGPPRQEPAASAAPAPPQEPAAATPEPSPAPRGPGGIDTDAIRRSWPDVLERLSQTKRVTWTFVSQNAQVSDYDGQRVLLSISTVGLAETFRRGPHADYVRQALIDVLGVDARVEGMPAESAPSAGAPSSSAAPAPTGPPAGPGAQPAAAGAPGPGDGPDASAQEQGPPPDEPGPPEPTASWSDAPPPPESAPEWASPLAQARANAARAAEEPEPTPRTVDDTAISDDDESIDELSDVGVPVVERILGGTVIREEQP